MRRRSIFLILGLLSIALATTATAAAARLAGERSSRVASTARQALPVIAGVPKMGFKPSTVYPDSNDKVTKVRWSVWTSQKAVAAGTLVFGGACGTGPACRPVSVTVTYSGPAVRSCPGRVLTFTHAVVTNGRGTIEGKLLSYSGTCYWVGPNGVG